MERCCTFFMPLTVLFMISMPVLACFWTESEAWAASSAFLATSSTVEFISSMAAEVSARRAEACSASCRTLLTSLESVSVMALSFSTTSLS